MTRTRDSGGVRIRKFCNSTDRSSQKYAQKRCTQLEPNSLNKDVYGIEVEIRLQGQVRENEEGE